MRKYCALLVFFFSALTVQAQNFSNGQAARAVLGQTNFTAGNPSPGQVILGGASGLAVSNGTLYVADSNRVAATPQNSRIMAFPTSEIPGVRDNLQNDNLTNSDCYLCGFPASFSLGQSTFVPANLVNGVPTFTISRTQTGMANATGVATDGQHFAVADTDNNRVLLWNKVPTAMNQPADIVLGQTGFTTFKTPQPVDKFSLRGPQSVWLQNNKLFVADTQNNRVLIWNTIPTQNNQGADLVLGQADFTHNSQPPPGPNNPVVSANQLLNPTSVTSDGTRLYVSDLGFNRVLIWNSIPAVNAQNADVVVGQPDMTQTAANNGSLCTGYGTGPIGECQTSLNYPRFALSNGTKLFIADGGNDRVLIWNTIPTTNGAPADEVLGEPDFIQDVVSSASISIASTAVDNNGGVDLLPTPQALAYDPTTQNLFVSDPYNRRVLVFTPGDTVLPPNSVVNWASEIIRQEGIVQFTVTTGGAITANDTATITIAGTAYAYTIKTGDTLDTIAKGLVALINAGAGDPNVTALFDGTGTGTVYLSSKATSIAYDSVSLAASESNSANLTATASGAYLSAGTAATGAMGMIVEINANGATFGETTASANLDGVTTLPTTLGGVQVYMDGYSCPLFKVSPTQIITQIPYGYVNRNSTSVYARIVHSDGSVSVTNAVPVYIAPANPGLFNAPASPGQVRPWPVTMATHQSGNPSTAVDISGSITAANTATITIAGVSYTYTVVAGDTLNSIVQNLVKLINATDVNVTASAGGAFSRVILTAKQPGVAGNGISVAATSSTNANITLTAYSSATCCAVTPNSLITASNPAAPGETINVSAVGLGVITDSAGVAQSSLGTGVPYAGLALNTAQSFVTATLGGATAQVTNAYLPQQSYGIYNIQMIVPPGQATNPVTQLYVAQNAFISNTVTIPVGPPVLVSGPTAPVTTITEAIDAPAAGATASGTFLASGWALSSVSPLTGVNVSIDGRPYGAARHDNVRTDVCALYTSPDCPTTGWYLPIDTTQFADGQHTLAVTALSSSGNHTISQSFFISNTATSAASGLHAAVDSPGSSFTYRGVVTFSGWSTSNSAHLAGVSIYIDGAPQGAATVNAPRPDVCALYGSSPDCPNGNLQWSFPFDTTKIADGAHTLTAKAVFSNGQTFPISQSFQIANFTGAGTTHAAIDSPSLSAGAFSGRILTSGWAVDDNTSINAVYVSVDGVSYGASAYGNARTDVCAIFADAGCPNVGWSAYVDTTLLADGRHTLAVTVVPSAGQSSTYTRTFSVANQATAANPVMAVIDAPATGASVSGTFSASGWAVGSADTVASVSLLVDGQSFGSATYGNSRTDVCKVFPTSQGCPNVGWYTNSLNSNLLGNGSHVLEATVTTVQGHRASVSQSFVVANAITGPAHIGFVTPGPNSNPFLGMALFTGYALNDNTKVNNLSVSIDGVPYGTATYNLTAPDGCVTYPGLPNCPADGWSFGIDTTRISDGTHTLGITENDADGTVYTASSTFTVSNYSTSNPMRIVIDTPVPSTSVGVFGNVSISGWAIDDLSAITGVNISIDGIPAGAASYGLSRPDVCTVYSGRLGCPNVGWVLNNFDTSLIPNGIHTIAITGVTTTGQTSTMTEQISIAN